MQALLLATAVLAAPRSQDAPQPALPDRAPTAPQVVVRTRGAAAFPGLTLVAPLNGTTTQLIDLDGKVVHAWRHDLPPGQSCYLMADGSLLRGARNGKNEVFGGGGEGGRIERWSWDGERVWSFDVDDATRLSHHDIAPLPNGNVLVIAWEERSEEECFEAGRHVDGLGEAGLWPDMVLELRPDGPTGAAVVWEWHVWDHLVQDVRKGRPTSGDPRALPGRVDLNLDLAFAQKSDEERAAEQAKLEALGYAAGGRGGGPGGPGGPGGGRRRADWLHTNAIDHDPETDLIVLSMREIGEVWVIDHSTTSEEARGATGGRQGRGGELLWRWGNPANHRAGAPADRQLFGQHDARWIGRGKLLVFDNGDGRPAGAYSRVVELDVPIDEAGLVARLAPGAPAAPAAPGWTYDEAPDGRFYSSHISGAQRLPNGNTLLCIGEEGRFLEVTRTGEVAWDARAPGDGRRGGAGRGGRRGPPGQPGDGAPRPGDPAGRPEGPPDGPRDGTPDRQPGDRRGPGARRGGGPGGPGGPGGHFRVTRVGFDHPGLARLRQAPAEDPPTR